MSAAIAAIIAHCQRRGYPVPEPEYEFAKPLRKWRLDLAWPTCLVALEIEGGIWTRGRHVRGAGFLKDMEKYNEAALRGWRLLRVTPGQISSGVALTLLDRLFGGE